MMNIIDFQKKKQSGSKISMVTCYDYTSARMLVETSVDCILVGDSAAMIMHGHKNTLSATVEMMQYHVAAVSRGVNDKKFIIGDMPFASYRKSFTDNITAAQLLMQAGAHAIKLEGAAGNQDFIKHVTQSGIPVMGHIGLTPQLMYMLGGLKVQGKTQSSAERLKEDALMLQEAGCFAIVIEGVPASLGRELTRLLTVPTIGVGAGPDTDGQVLVLQDLLGLTADFKPKFVKAFIDGQAQYKEGVEAYIKAVNLGEFPTDEHCY